MTARILGSIGKDGNVNITIPKSFLKRNNKETQLENANFSITSADSLQCFKNEAILCVVDWNIYAYQNKNIEGFIKSYQNYGIEGAVKQLNGEFAIALYDAKIDSLFLVRDRFGYKPLYYCHNNYGVAFASHPTWLLQFPGISREVNARNVALFAGGHYRFIDNDIHSSLINEVYQVPASHIISIIGPNIRKNRYWCLDSDAKLYSIKDEEKLAQHYRELFIASVGDRVKCNSEQTCYLLSGGLDSSSVLSASVLLTGEKKVAFSTTYEDKTYDESDEIKTLLGDCVSEWNAMQLSSPDIFNVVEKMVEDNDGPVATATWLSHYLLYEKIHNAGYSSVFGGLGGDELNAGEFEYFFYYFADLKKTGQEEKLRDEIDAWVKYHDHSIYKKNYDVASMGWKSLTDQKIDGKILFDKGKYSKYFNAVNRDFFKLDNFDPFFVAECNGYLNNKTYSDIFHETIPCCFRANDRHDFKYNINTIFPFFDYRLVEFMYRIPPELKIRNGITKHLLRVAMEGILPDTTRLRIKKTGWNAPFHQWIIDKKNKGNLLDIIHSRTFKERGIYNVDVVHKLFEEHEKIIENQENRENHMMFFWQLINLELWLQKI